MLRSFIICLKTVGLYLRFKQIKTTKYSWECYFNLPCGCANPGRELKCEDCHYLEYCLSRVKQQGAYGNAHLRTQKPPRQHLFFRNLR
jgi:hypothetical protein